MDKLRRGVQKIFGAIDRVRVQDYRVESENVKKAVEIAQEMVGRRKDEFKSFYGVDPKNETGSCQPFVNEVMDKAGVYRVKRIPNITTQAIGRLLEMGWIIVESEESMMPGDIVYEIPVPEGETIKEEYRYSKAKGDPEVFETNEILQKAVNGHKGFIPYHVGVVVEGGQAVYSDGSSDILRKRKPIGFFIALRAPLKSK
ncbi:MAG: hypothetical protein HZA35_04165 [Parcubacteria group bacterium]|nr:hypothetical protein [Parcubacteria group bacterium]